MPGTSTVPLILPSDGWVIVFVEPDEGILENYSRVKCLYSLDESSLLEKSGEPAMRSRLPTTLIPSSICQPRP